MQSVPLLLALILLGSASAQAQVTIEPVTTRGQTNCELCAKSSVVALQTALRSIFGTKSVCKGCDHETCRQISATHAASCVFWFFVLLDTLPTKTPHPPHKSKATCSKLMLSLPCNRIERIQQASAFMRQLLRIMRKGSTSECCIYFVAMSWSHIS